MGCKGQPPNTYLSSLPSMQFYDVCYDVCYDELILNNYAKICYMKENLTFEEREKKQIENAEKAIIEALKENKKN